MSDVVLTSELVRSAIRAKLAELFPDVTAYRESVTNPKFPNFFIDQLTADSECRVNKGNVFRYLFNLRYRHVADVTREPNLNVELDRVGFRLLSEMKLLEIDDYRIVISSPRYERQEGILFFFCNIQVPTWFDDGNVVVPFKNLEKNTHLRD